MIIDGLFVLFWVGCLEGLIEFIDVDEVVKEVIVVVGYFFDVIYVDVSVDLLLIVLVE